MSPEIDKDGFLTAAIAGVPGIVGQIVRLAPSEQPQALLAAKQSYLQIARGLGYDEFGAQLWASTVMARLKMNLEEIDMALAKILRDEADLLYWLVSETDSTG